MAITKRHANRHTRNNVEKKVKIRDGANHAAANPMEQSSR